MNINLEELKTALAAVKTNLHSDLVVNHIQAQLSDPAVQAKLNDDRSQDADKLAADTNRVPQSFEQAKGDLGQLQGNQEPWMSRWQSLHQAYTDAVKRSLNVDKSGIAFFADFNTQVIGKITWDDDHFDQAKALIADFINKPEGGTLEQDSAGVSQLYTDNRRAVSQYRDEFSSFVDKLTADNQQAQGKLNGDIQNLQAQIAQHESTANQIVSALRQIAGIPSWMSWVISEILGALHITSADDARRALDQNYAEQQRLKEQQESVRQEMAQVDQMNVALARAKTTLLNLTQDVTDIDGRLDSFAKEWAEYHHDIVSIGQEMQAAADSATRRSLISRLKLMGSSVDALIAAMTTYVQAVGGSGLFN